MPAESPLRNTTGRLGWRIDSRGAGGYIVAAGSVHRNGLYTVMRDLPIAPLPDWLVPLLAPPDPPPLGFSDLLPLSDGRKHAYLDTVLQRVAAAKEGTRHHVLLHAAVTLGRLVAGGEFADDEVRAGLHAAADRLTAFPPREANRCIDDGLRYGNGAPRRLAS